MGSLKIYHDFSPGDEAYFFDKHSDSIEKIKIDWIEFKAEKTFNENNNITYVTQNILYYFDGGEGIEPHELFHTPEELLDDLRETYDDELKEIHKKYLEKK